MSATFLFHNKVVTCLAAGAVAFLMAISCQKAEEDVAVPSVDGEPFTFSVVEEDPIKVDPATKSVLTDGTIETKRTSVTIGIYYPGGALVASQYYTSFGDMTFPLENGVAYTAYALVNMGDMRSSLPGTTAGLSSLTYTIPAYTGTAESVNSRGIPMAGSLTFTVSGTSAEIPVKRLLAKVTAVLSCDWGEAKIKSAKVYNMNKTLKPFGVSAATGSSDMLGFQELQTAVGEGTTSLTATFYVPENMQGTVSGILLSSDKAGDRNATVGLNAAKLTYLETSVESEGRYDGTIVYRSYLGNNATTNFDIERNYRYAWTIHYKSDKVDDWDDDWKHDYDDLEIIDYSLSVSPASATVTAGSTLPLATTLTRNVIRPSASSTSNPLATTSASWTSSNPSVATVSTAGVVTGVATGSATITARYTPEHFTERTASALITVQTISNYITVTPASSTVDWTETVPLTARYYTVTDGTPDAGVDITTDPGTVWSKYDGDASVSVSSTGVVSASTYGSAVIRATYAGQYGSANVQFNRTDRTLVLGHTPATPVAGQNVQMTALIRTVTNGVLQPDTDLSASSVTWSIAAKSDPSAVVSVTAAGILTASKAVTVTVQGNYAGYGGLVATHDVTFAPATGHLLVIDPTSVEKEVGESATLSAKLVTITDGVPDAGVLVPAAWTMAAGGSSNINFTPSSGTTTTLTASAYGSATICADYNPGDGMLHAECPVVFHETTHRLIVTANGATTKNVGQTVYLIATYYTDRDGVNQSSEVVSVASGASWSRVDGSANLSVVKGSTYAEVTATAGGTASFRVSYAGMNSNTISVTFTDVVTYELEITPMGPITGKTYLSPANMTAMYYTVTNGVRNAGTNVTASATWNKTGGTKYAVSAGVVSAVPTAGTPSVAGTTNVSATYSAVGSNTVSVTFDDIVDHEVRVTSSAESIQAAGSSVYFYANYYTVTNGFDTGSPVNVSSDSGTSWSSNNANVSLVKETNRAIATANASATGTMTGTATYSLKSGSHTITVTDASIDYELEIVRVSGSGTYLSPIQLQARYYTLIAGVRQPGYVDVTSSASWSITTQPCTPSRHSVSSTGLVSADASVGNHSVAGTPIVRAVYSGKSDDYDGATFTDIITYDLRVTSSAEAIQAAGSPVYFYANYYTITNGYDGTPLDVSGNAGITWTSSNANVSLVKESTRATATANASATGTMRATAGYSGKSAYKDITVTSAAVDYELEVEYVSGSGTYASPVQLQARYYTLIAGVRQPGYVDVTDAATWSIVYQPYTPSRHSVSAGLVSADASVGNHYVAGSPRVRATYSGKSDEYDVTFSDVMTYDLAVSPSSGSIEIDGPAVNLRAYYTEGVNGYGTPVDVTTNPACTWTSSHPRVEVTTYGGNAVVSAELGAAGPVTITASYSGHDAACVLDVLTHSLVLQNLTGTGTYLTPVSLRALYKTFTNGVETNSEDVTSAADYIISQPLSPSRFSVSSSGVVTANAAVGNHSVAATPVVSASYGGEDSNSLGVPFTDIKSLAIYNSSYQPVSMPKVAVGANITLRARYTLNGYNSYVTAAWTSGTTSVATVGGSNGVVHGVSVGSSVITASYDGQSANATVSVVTWDDDWDDDSDLNL